MSGIENEPMRSLDGGISSWSGEGGNNGDGFSSGLAGTFSDDGINRPRPLTIPSVIEPDKPNGFPIATTGWPILRSKEFANGNGSSFRDDDKFCTCSTATSLNGSEPISLAS